MATNDIYNFANKQGILRKFNKAPDWNTMKAAREIKVCDLKKVLIECHNTQAKRRKDLLCKLDFKSFKLLKKTRRIKK